MKPSVIWLCLGVACTSSVPKDPAAAIDALHQRDVAATLASDPDQLAALWTDNGVLLGDGEPAVVGATALRAAYATGGTRVVAYTPHIETLTVTGDVAFEWGHFDATFQSSDAAQTRLHARFLRVMRRQPDGSWRFARIMWQTDPPQGAPPVLRPTR